MEKVKKINIQIYIYIFFFVSLYVFYYATIRLSPHALLVLRYWLFLRVTSVVWLAFFSRFPYCVIITGYDPKGSFLHQIAVSFSLVWNREIVWTRISHYIRYSYPVSAKAAILNVTFIVNQIHVNLKLYFFNTLSFLLEANLFGFSLCNDDVMKQNMDSGKVNDSQYRRK